MRTLDSDKKEIEKSYYVKMLETFRFIHRKATASCLEKDLFGFIISLEVKNIWKQRIFY